MCYDVSRVVLSIVASVLVMCDVRLRITNVL